MSIVQKKKHPSGHGKGIWHNESRLKRYRDDRKATKKRAKLARKRNRT